METLESLNGDLFAAFEKNAIEHPLTQIKGGTLKPTLHAGNPDWYDDSTRRDSCNDNFGGPCNP